MTFGQFLSCSELSEVFHRQLRNDHVPQVLRQWREALNSYHIVLQIIGVISGHSLRIPFVLCAVVYYDLHACGARCATSLSVIPTTVYM